MATESDLRDLLRDPEPEPRKNSGGGAIDVDAVLRRAHSRRRPRVIAATAVGALAMVGVFTPIVLSSLPRSASDSSALSSQEVAGGTAPMADSDLERAKSAQSLNSCAAAPVVVDAPSNGLVLDVAPVTANATANSIEATVTLRNAGTEHLLGTTGIMPALTFFADNSVLWHSNGMTSMIAVPIDLEPGETSSYTAEFEPVRCSPEDDANGFGDNLPKVGPGAYWLSAAIDFVPTDGSTTGPVVVTGPAVPVELR